MTGCIHPTRSSTRPAVDRNPGVRTFFELFAERGAPAAEEAQGGIRHERGAGSRRRARGGGDGLELLVRGHPLHGAGVSGLGPRVELVHADQGAGRGDDARDDVVGPVGVRALILRELGGTGLEADRGRDPLALGRSVAQEPVDRSSSSSRPFRWSSTPAVTSRDRSLSATMVSTARRSLSCGSGKGAR